MKNTLLVLLLGVLFISSCKKNKINEPNETELISGKTFNETVLIDGHNYNGLIIENCIFENIDGDALLIRDVNNLTIRNCTFREIGDDAIRFRNSGSSNNVLIQDNLIYNIQGNGILAYETHSNTTIKGNTIHNVGLESISSVSGAPQHGIYFQGTNFLITQNIIYNVINENGNCISVRSYGKITRNTLYNADKHGVSYYSDHPGVNGELTIENNFIYDNGKRGVNLNTNGNQNSHIGNTIIRFNSIVVSSKSAINISTGMSDIGIEIYGNILVRTDGNSNIIEFIDPITSEQNLTSSNDIGFLDFNNRDLHINTTSSAKNYAVGISNFPINDFDGENRTNSGLDAGADDIQ
ncbi:MAG: right-handed parallel beta-helix repeat-containing protein [Melioribacteraceae bacterium]